MSILPFISAFILTFVTTPPAAKVLFKKGILGVDLHKEGEIKVPEMGGISVYFSVLVVLAYHYMDGMDLLLAPIFAFYIIGVLGIIDGFTRLSAAQKVTSFFVVGVFLAWGLGFRGTGPVLLIGFLYMCAVNFTNMLAGFNGLEIGTGAIRLQRLGNRNGHYRLCWNCSSIFFRRQCTWLHNRFSNGRRTIRIPVF
jgi:UDP-N-acetylglucosamine--dolichyl-phosphate N-acetylglucosaminephosphotransferase